MGGQGENPAVLSCVSSPVVWKVASEQDFNPSGANQYSQTQLPRSLGRSHSRPPPNTTEFSLDLQTALAPMAVLDKNALLKITGKWGKEPVPALSISTPASPPTTAKHCFTRGYPALKSDFYTYTGEGIDILVLSLLS